MDVVRPYVLNFPKPVSSSRSRPVCQSGSCAPPAKYWFILVSLRTKSMSAQMSPPPGGDVNKGPMFLGVTVSGTVVATITLFLRLYARARFVKTIGWDDGCIIFATVSALPRCVTVAWLDRLGCHVD